MRALSILGVVDSRHGGGAFVTDLEARTLLAPLDFFLSLSETNLADAFEARRIVEIAIVRKRRGRSDGRGCRRCSTVCWPPTPSSSPTRLASASSTAASMPACPSYAGQQSCSSASPMRLYNMGLDIRRRATEDPALIRRSLDEHTAIVRAIGRRRPRRGGARHGRPPRAHRGQYPRRDRGGRRRILATLARRSELDERCQGRILTCRPDAR